MKEQAQDPVPPAKDAENAQGAQTPRKRHAGRNLHLVLFLRLNSKFSRDVYSIDRESRAALA